VAFEKWSKTNNICLMLFYFRKEKNATQTREKIYAVYKENAVSERVCKN